MFQTATNPSVYYSSLAQDEDLSELVLLFVGEMPDRVAALVAAAENQNWEVLGQLAHQLKGAGGSYGFEQLTPFAKALEFAAKNQIGEGEILASLDQLLAACQRIRPGISP